MLKSEINSSKLFLLSLMVLLLQSCTGIPSNVEAVKGFELDRYLGTWYEIARLDHSFERGMTNVTAFYEMREDGGVKVTNQGFVLDESRWAESIGKAFFIDEQDVGRLKVSFFGPFYGGYNIIDLDQDGYSWSLVVGPDTSFLWILSRTPEMDAETYDKLVDKARSAGFPVDDLIKVSQSPVPPYDS
jgi:apolipoprotein D and lipocalin family protein